MKPASIFRAGILTALLALAWPAAAAIPVEQAGLDEAIARYEGYVKEGGWPSIDELAEGKAIVQGESDERVAKLRSRLAITGDLDREQDNGDTTMAPEVAEALKRFQDRHGLEEDGILGPESVAALNIPANERLEQLKASTEQWRELVETIGQERAVVVNIPDFRLQAMQGGQTVLEMKVIVGKELNESPAFSDEMEYVELSPDWTVPESIVKEEILPKAIEDPGYLQAQHFEIIRYEGNEARVVDPSSIEWSETTPETFQYGLRQKPGPWNALGRIKFMFPNEHAVYLHDSPDEELFQKRERLFSHGCIRVEKPVELAQLVLNEQPEAAVNGDGEDGAAETRGEDAAETRGEEAARAPSEPEWTAEKIRSEIETSEQKRVDLPAKVPVHIVYLTAWVAEDGSVQFRKDIYEKSGEPQEVTAEDDVERSSDAQAREG
jgi:L,D-transpeptidase YcbB